MREAIAELARAQGLLLPRQHADQRLRRQDRVRISRRPSPGLELEDLMMGVSACRNPHLANVFYRLQLIEAYGTG